MSLELNLPLKAVPALSAMELVDVVGLKVAGVAFKNLMGGEVGGALDTSEGEALVFRVQCDRDCWLSIF